jgi:hypothetical protein
MEKKNGIRVCGLPTDENGVGVEWCFLREKALKS